MTDSLDPVHNAVFFTACIAGDMRSATAALYRRGDPVDHRLFDVTHAIMKAVQKDPYRAGHYAVLSSRYMQAWLNRG